MACIAKKGNYRNEQTERIHQVRGTLDTDRRINQLSLAIIREFARIVTAWLGKINLYPENKGKPVMWIQIYLKGLVRNFGAGFVIPCHDLTLEQMILERDQTPYTGTKADYTRVTAIMNRINEIGCVPLFWQ